VSPPRVSLLRQKDYEPAALLEAMKNLLEPLGGMQAFVKPGDRVIIKPNSIAGRPPEEAVTTHPQVVRAAAILALDCGAGVGVGDSPGREPLRKAGARSGFQAVIDELGLDWIDFTPAEVTAGTGMFPRLVLARELLEADVVINIPKLKTHCMMLMTMAVKNLFGAVLGLQKFQWHLRAGRDKDLFGRMLHEICRTVNPALSIVDAVVSCDGDGPTAGDPNPTGFLAAGADPSAVDAVLMDVVGIPRRELWTLRAAAAADDRGWEEAGTVGASPAELKPKRWNMPETVSAGLPLPQLFQRIPFFREWLRGQTTARPFAIKALCILCGECAAACPAGVMTLTESTVAIDHDGCIRCYCCHEICPQRAIGLRKGFLGRLFGKRRD